MVPNFLLQTIQQGSTLDTSLLSFFMPLFMFMFVFAVVYSLLKVTKLLGDSQFANLIISFTAAIIFVVTPSAITFTSAVTPWMIVFIISLLFVFLILSWLKIYDVGGKGGGGLANALGSTWVAWLVLIIILVIFIFAGISAFGPSLSPFDSSSGGTDAELIGSGVKDVLFHPAILGVALLFVIAAVVSWILSAK